jgi:hypothetical protein
VRTKVIAGTLAIEEIRRHGGEKALERLTAAATEAKANGKAKVTKKTLAKSASDKISAAQAKQLLQALQSVLHDPLFGKLSPGTIAGVHTALTPLADLLDAAPQHREYPIHVANEHGMFVDCETIASPISKRTGTSPARIHLAQPEEGTWISSVSLRIGTEGHSSLPSMTDFHSYPTRVQAIQGSVHIITRALERPEFRKSKEAKSLDVWLDKLHTMPDPDWTEEMAVAAKEAS